MRPLPPPGVDRPVRQPWRTPRPRGWTGPEILRQMQGRIGAVVLAVSTGGTLAGIAAWLRRVSPATRIIGVDARGSVVFGTPPVRGAS